MKTLATLFYAVGAVAKFYESRALSQTLVDLLHCEKQELKIHEQINSYTNSDQFDSGNPQHANHLDALNRWLRQWQGRKASFDERLQRAES